MAKKSTAAENLIIEARRRYKRAQDADRTNRQEALADLKFVNEPGAQWDATTKQRRGSRPCYEFNKLRVTCKRIINDMRMNRPQGKVRGTEETDKKTAEVYEGLCRNIWAVSDGDTVIDSAADYQVPAGMAAWRVNVKYATDSAWEQDIVLEGFRNPFCVWVDPSAQDPLYRDAGWWIVSTRMSKEAYQARWPKAEVVSFEENEFDDEEEWEDADSVRLLEYWYKAPVKKTLYLMPDGSTREQSDGTHVRERVVNTHQIKMAILSAGAVLEEADWAGAMFPFVMIHGERMVLDGKAKWWGLVRFAKDAQRAYNHSRTAATESVALAPQFKWWATPTQAEGLVSTWREAHESLMPFMLYNPDPKTGGAPPMDKRGADVPAALINEIQFASEDIKAVTGIFDSSLGKQSNETTGVAIRQRQAQGEIVTFNFQDNLAKGIRRTWEILIDLIPRIYDTARTVRVLGVDGAEKYLQVNGLDPMSGEMVNDLSRGKYDVTVSTGPSFATQRQEAAETYMAVAQAVPQAFGVAGDLIFKAMDLPYSDQIAERLKMMLPPQIQQAESQGVEMPPEVMQAMAQADQAMQMVQEQAAVLEEASGKMEEEAAGIEQQKAELAKQAAALSVQVANFKAEVAQRNAELTQKEAQFTLQQAQAGSDEAGAQVAADRESLSVELQAAVAAIQQQAAQFMQQAAQTLVDMQQAAQPQVVVADPPKRKVVRVRRVNGELVGEVQELTQEQI